jgi:hypothetical protein
MRISKNALLNGSALLEVTREYRASSMSNSTKLAAALGCEASDHQMSSGPARSAERISLGYLANASHLARQGHAASDNFVRGI